MYKNVVHFPDQAIIRSIKRPCKGQLISKCIFGVFNSPEKRTKKFNFTTMLPEVELFLLFFLEELKTPKRHFEIIDL